MTSTSCETCVLVVEDEEDIRDGLAALLEIEGYQVEVASNGKEALDYLRSHPAPCVILLDLMMPIMSGDQFRAAQLADAAIAGIPVVVLTAAQDGARRAAALGALGCFSKPPKIDKLLATVRHHC